MPFDFAFRSVQTAEEVRQTVDFLARQDLQYPHYDEWVQKAESELHSGYKRAGLAYSNGILVGDIVWQLHKELPRVREMKNLRINPQARGRYLAQFLIRQAEVEDKRDCDAMIVDARETQHDLIELMGCMGYSILSKLNLYEEDRRDVVLFKSFDKSMQDKLIVSVRESLRPFH
ncbi:MAG: hypothetical protein ABIH72_02845 [archaeon]